jgi:MFS family permease
LLGVLRRRDFALLWLSGLVSIAGDWVLFAALPYFVYQETGSTAATAGMTVAELAPGVVLASAAGVFADRWDRRRVLIISNLLQGVTVAALLVIADGGYLWVVYVVAALQSAVSAFAMPAEAALLPTLVPAERLVEANALNVLNNRLGRLIGVPLGGILLAALGLQAVVAVDSLTFLVAAGLVAPIVAPASGRGAEAVVVGPAQPATEVRTALAGLWVEWLDGLRIVRDDTTIATLFLVFGLMTFGGTMLDPLAAPWVRDVLESGADVYAALLAVHAVAGIAGAIGVGALGRRAAPRVLIGWSSLIAGVSLLVRFNLPVVWVALVLSGLSGVLSVASSVGTETLAQQRVPERLRGRVFGSLQSTTWLLSLLGAAAGGAIGSLAGVIPALDVASSLVGVSGLVVLMAVSKDVVSANSAQPTKDS